MTTLKDIARLAGVSQGTVSNVLSGKGNVSSQKIRLVEEAAARLGYTANEHAKSLRKGHSNILALVVPDIDERRYHDIYSSLKKRAEDAGYEVSLYLTNDIPARELRQIEKIRSDMAAGAVIISCITESSNPYLDLGFRNSELLFLERKPPFPCNYLGFDYILAGQNMGRLFSCDDASCCALIIGSPAFSNDRAFVQGFTRCLDTAQLNRLKQVNVKRTQKSKDLIPFIGSLSHVKQFFVSDFSLAEALDETLQAFFPDLDVPEICTLSHLYTLPEMKYRKYELNYRQMGNYAARRILEQLAAHPQQTREETLPNSGFRNWDPLPMAAPRPQSLNLLMLDGPEAIAVQNLSRIYSRQTNTSVNISIFSYDEIFEILSSTGGEAFDILRIDITFLSWFAQKLLQPLEDLDPHIRDTLPQFLDGVALPYSTIGGRLYALPFSPSVQLLYYRKDLFESNVLRRLYREKYKCELLPPSSFTEYNRIAAFFTHAMNPSSPVEFGTGLTLGSISVAGSEFLARFFEKQKNLYSEDGLVHLNSDAGRASMRQLIELRSYAPPQGNTWWTDSASSFASGKLAMVILFNNYASDLLRGSSFLSDKIGFTLVPGGNPILGGASLGISKFSQKQEAALNFIKWLTSETVSSAATLLGGVPARRDVCQNYELIDAFPWLEFAGRGFLLANGNRQLPEESRPFNERLFMNILGMAVKNAYSQVLTPDEALDWAQREYERYFTL